MMRKETITGSWFTIEPYVYMNIVGQQALLYNTLDGTTIESEQPEVIELLQEVRRKENHGVVFLSDEKRQDKKRQAFLAELREKYMGDCIDVSLSKGKPVQVLPYFNFYGTQGTETYKRHNFSSDRGGLKMLSTLCIEVDRTTKVAELIAFLQSIPPHLSFHLVGNIGEAAGYEKLVGFLHSYASSNTLVCSYADVIPLPPGCETNFSYSLVVDFPVDKQKWDHSRQLLATLGIPFEYIFEVTSVNDCREAQQLIEASAIEQYQVKPVYTGANLPFLEENVFLTQEDILASPLSIQTIFANQAINTYDFGKIHIRPNGDVFANRNHPSLGNIYKESLHDLVQKEIKEGKSWLRIRNQAPCNGCIYQWLCPSPSDFEIAIGRPDLCHVHAGRGNAGTPI